MGYREFFESNSNSNSLSFSADPVRVAEQFFSDPCFVHEALLPTCQDGENMFGQFFHHSGHHKAVLQILHADRFFRLLNHENCMKNNFIHCMTLASSPNHHLLRLSEFELWAWGAKFENPWLAKVLPGKSPPLEWKPSKSTIMPNNSIFL